VDVVTTSTNESNTASPISPPRWLGKAGRSLVTLTLIYWVVQELDWGQVWASVLSAKVGWLAMALLYPFLSIAIDTFRWQLLWQAMCRHVAWSKLFRINLIGLFLDNLLPGNVGSDAYRTLCLSRQYDTRDVFATVLLNRVLGWFGLLVIALVGLLALQNQLPPDTFWSGLLVLSSGLCIMTVGFGLLNVSQFWSATCLYNRMLRRCERLKLLVETVRRLMTSQTFILGTILSLLLHTVVIIATVMFAKAYGVPSKQLTLVACVAPLGLIAAMLPISIAGHGVRETAFIYLLSHIGISPEIALTISISLYVTIAITSIIGGIIYMFSITTQSRKRMKNISI